MAGLFASGVLPRTYKKSHFRSVSDYFQKDFARKFHVISNNNHFLVLCQIANILLSASIVKCTHIIQNCTCRMLKNPAQKLYRMASPFYKNKKEEKQL